MNEEALTRSPAPSVPEKVRQLFHDYPRSCWIAVIVGFAMPLYFPINAYTDRSRAVTLDFSVDHSIPFVGGWIFIYTLVYMSSFFPLLVVKSSQLVHRMAASFFSTFILAYVCFLILPVTTVPLSGEAFRPSLASIDDSTFTGWVLCLNFYLDPPNNCFPSLHIAQAFVGAFATLKADKFYGGVATVAAVLISLSTMLVKQHYLADVMAGFVLSCITGYVFLWSYTPESDNPLDIRFKRVYGALFAPAWLAAVATCYYLFQSGFHPWR